MFYSYNFKVVWTYIQCLSILFLLCAICQFALVCVPSSLLSPLRAHVTHFLPFIQSSVSSGPVNRLLLLSISYRTESTTAALPLSRSPARESTVRGRVAKPSRAELSWAELSWASFVMCLTFHFGNRKIQSSPAGMECGCCPEFLMGQQHAALCIPPAPRNPPPATITLSSSTTAALHPTAQEGQRQAKRLNMYFAKYRFGLDIDIFCLSPEPI
jgi:hypothetical protein